MSLLRLVIRDIRVNSNILVLLSLVFPVVFMTLGGLAYARLIGDIEFRGVTVSYVAYLAPGILVMNLLGNATSVGTLVWGDRRTGMFEQILVGPYKRGEYVFSKVLSSALFSLVVAIPVAIIAILLGARFKVSANGLVFGVIAIFLGALFSGIVISLSTLIRNQQIISSAITLLFYLLPFSSSVFYPTDNLPFPVNVVAPWNPVTLVSDIVRAGFYGLAIDFTAMSQTLILALWAVAFLLIAVRVLHRAKV